MPHKTLAGRAALREKRKAAGLCVNGDKRQSVPGKTVCSECLEQIRGYGVRRTTQRKSDGLCLGCGAVLKNEYVSCDECRAKASEQNTRRYHEHRSMGKCTWCDQPADAGIRCRYHWFKCLASKHGINTEEGVEMLIRIFDAQCGLCALTGAELIPGTNASLDHKLPTSRGGTNDESNLHWTTTTVNRAKWNLTVDEFKALCAAVVNNNC